MITIPSIIAVNRLFISVAFLKDRVECLVSHLDLGSPDTVVPNVLVELASRPLDADGTFVCHNG